MNIAPRDSEPVYRKLCRRDDTPGDVHSLTFHCFKNQPFLKSERACRWMLDAIESARRSQGFHLWAYVLMPEHVHLLIAPGPNPSGISTILARLEEPIARRAVRYVRDHAPSFLPRMLEHQASNVTPRFWQRGGGYDRNLRNPRYVWQTIDYIHNNPTRRSLCDRPELWPWSSAAEFATPGSGPLSIDFASLPPDPRS